MGLFSAMVGMAVEAAKLPVDMAVDACTLCEFGDRGHTVERLQKIKEEAEKADA